MKENLIKIALIGDEAVGKTWLFNTIVHKDLPKTYFTTKEVQKGKFKHIVQDNQQEFEIIELQSNKEYDKIRNLYYKDGNFYQKFNFLATVFLVCFNGSKTLTLESVTERWVPEIRSFCPKVPIILVKTKSDEKDDVKITNQATQAYKKLIQAVHYVECSSLTQENIELLLSLSILASIQYEKEKNVQIQSSDSDEE